MKRKLRETLSRAARAAAAAALSVSMALGGVIAPVGQAFAASGTGYLATGHRVEYAGAHTTYFTVDGFEAYCANPSKYTPPAGNYAKVAPILTDPSRADELRADMWFSYGAPGFDESMWPSKWYDGSPMTADRYRALSHIIIADTSSSDGNAALFGCNSTFRQWCRQNVIGFGENGAEINTEATGRQMWHRAAEVPGPDRFDVFMLRTGSTTQNILSFTYKPDVKVTFNKTSADASFTYGNKEYSYAGAVYEIHDASDDSLVATITTDDGGHASYDLAPSKEYYAVETKAPAGFKLSGERVYFTTGDAASPVTLEDEPGTVRVTVVKKDSATGGEPQPGASLEGAEFRLVDANGKVHTAVTDGDGTCLFEGIPLGKVSVTETKAPEGYKLDREVHEYYVDAGQLPAGGVVELEPEDDFLEDVIAFDLEISKFKDHGQSGSGVEQPAEGVVFEIVSNTTGKTVGRIETNAYGFADTSEGSLWFGEGERPEGVNGAIPYDRAGYTIHEDESTVPEGFEHAGDWTISMEDVADGAKLQYIVDNHRLSTRLQIVKTDAASGQTVPLAGFRFQVLDAEGNPITQEDWYPNHVELSEFTTDESGRVTLPEPLMPGDYFIREVASQPPYLLGGEDLAFTIPDDQNLAPVSIVKFSDEQATGSATVTKRDAETGEALEGAGFDVVARETVKSPDGTVQAVEGEIVGHVETGKDGTATIAGLPLGDGKATYAFVETSVPDGFVLDPGPHEFTLSYADAEMPVVSVGADVPNEPNGLVVTKADTADPDKHVPGTKFLWWNANDEVDLGTGDEPAIALRSCSGESWTAVGSDGAKVELSFDAELGVYAESGLEQGVYGLEVDGVPAEGELLVTDGTTFAAAEAQDGDEGVAKVSEVPYLMKPGCEQTALETGEDGTLSVERLSPGTYRIQESEAVPGYVLDPTVRSVTVGEDGTIRGDWLASQGGDAAAVLENDFTKVEISKLAATGSEELPGAHLSLRDAEGNVVAEWVSGEEPHTVTHLAPGKYTLVESMTPKNYDQAESIEFEVLETGEIQRVEMRDEPIEVSGEVDKRQQIADPIAADTAENGDSMNRADVTASPDGKYSYTVDFRSTSSTWTDEFTVTDEIAAAADGLATLEGITTPVAGEDYDGLLNVWYKTSSGKTYEAADANATTDDGHENPWLADEANADALGDDRRAVDYEGWNLWTEGVSATEATELSVSDLGLDEGDEVVAVRLEYGRVEAGFTSRPDGWEREDIKDEHDDIEGLPSAEPTGAPLKVHMKLTESYVEGTSLENEALVDLYRNGGGDGLEDHDSDKVVQTPKFSGGTLDQTGDGAAAAALGLLAAAAALAAVAIHRRGGKPDGRTGAGGPADPE